MGGVTTSAIDSANCKVTVYIPRGSPAVRMVGPNLKRPRRVQSPSDCQRKVPQLSTCLTALAWYSGKVE